MTTIECRGDAETSPGMATTCVGGSDVAKRNQPDAFWAKVDRSGGPNACWPWLGTLSSVGYGVAHFDGRSWGAYRLAWYLTHGEVPPKGLVLDHQCHNGDPTCPRGVACMHRRCCNPAHLEPVPQSLNVRRGMRDVCPLGHPYSGDNLRVTPKGHRACRACQRIGKLKFEAKQRAAVPPEKPPEAT